jgi:hypothetical protein
MDWSSMSFDSLFWIFEHFKFILFFLVFVKSALGINYSSMIIKTVICILRSICTQGQGERLLRTCSNFTIIHNSGWLWSCSHVLCSAILMTFIFQLNISTVKINGMQYARGLLFYCNIKTSIVLMKKFHAKQTETILANSCKCHHQNFW